MISFRLTCREDAEKKKKTSKRRKKKAQKQKRRIGPCEARTHDLGVAVGPEVLVYQHRALPTELTDQL